MDSATLSDMVFLPIPLWTWSGCNGLATENQVATGYNAITNHGRVSDFSYLIWNDMVYKMNNILINVHETGWDSYDFSAFYDLQDTYGFYTNYSQVKMSADDKTLSARRWNGLRFPLNYLYANSYDASYDLSTGLAITGQIVKGSLFTDLTDAINEFLTYWNEVAADNIAAQNG